jgi:N-acetyl-alpha-D-glucosaminyl L-malate synthase BshA
MKLAILCHSSAGGSGILATELALGLSQQGHEVHVIGERPPFRMTDSVSEPIYRDLGDAPPLQSFWGQIVQIVRRSFSGRFRASEAYRQSGLLHFHELLSFEYPLFDHSSFPTLRGANTLARLIDKYKIELVNAHYVIPHATSALLARDSGLGCRVVTTLHGTDVTRAGQDPAFFYTTKHAINSSDGVTAVCNFLVDEARRSFSITRPISVIPNWVDSERFKRITDTKARSRYAQPDEQICVHISNFRSVKRSIEAVKTFAQLLENVPSRLILVGEGPEKIACIDLAISLGVSGRVLSIGPVAAVEEIVGIADILLLPSEIEAFPLVLLEGMAAGAICLASDVGGVSELITDGENGFLFPHDDCSKMAETAEELFNNSELANTVRSNARQMVIDEYSPEKLIRRYASIYEDILRI